MNMSMSDISRYPKLAHYIKNELPKVIDSHSIVSAMNTIAGLNRKQLKDALNWNFGPSIKITHLNGAHGEFTPNIQSDEIRVNSQLAANFELTGGQKIARAGYVYLIGVTILHELVHWGDDQNGIDRPGEEGDEFERLVYGSVIN